MSGELELEYRLTWEAFIFGAWSKTERIAGADSDIKDQAETLAKWERTGEELVRNVKLEQREARPGGWEPAA